MVARLAAWPEEADDAAARIGEEGQTGAVRDVPAAARKQPRSRLARRDYLDGKVWRRREVLGDLSSGVTGDPLAMKGDEVGHGRDAGQDHPRRREDAKV